MITAAAAAQICSDLYDPSKQASWLHYWDAESVVVAHTKVGDSDVLVFRGSKAAIDWMRDFEGWPTFDKQLGFVHAGFLDGMTDVLGETKAVLGLKVVITGHSLGGARARVFAALREVNKLPVDQLVVFGSPKPGFANLSRVIQKSGMAHSSYRNRNDPVPLVPGILPLWEHPEPWVALNEKPAANDLEALRDHHIALYLAGVTKLVSV